MNTSTISSHANEFAGKRILVTGGTKGVGDAGGSRAWVRNSARPSVQTAAVSSVEEQTPEKTFANQYSPRDYCAAAKFGSGKLAVRSIPSFCIFQMSVVRLRPNRAAAPFGPPTTQRVFPSVSMMCSRSHSSSVAAFAVAARAPLTVWPLDDWSSSRGGLRTVVRDRMTARSTKFSNSRTLPGQ